jgi:hypothetical protein
VKANVGNLESIRSPNALCVAALRKQKKGEK